MTKRRTLLVGLLLAASLSAAAEPSPAALTWGADAQGGAPYVFQDPMEPNRVIGFEVELNTGPRMGFRETYDPDARPPEDGRFWYALDRSILHQSGRALHGPPAGAMFADVSPADLRTLLIDALTWWMAHATRVGTEDAVLGACRSLVRHRDGTWLAKPRPAVGSPVRGDRPRYSGRRSLPAPEARLRPARRPGCSSSGCWTRSAACEHVEIVLVEHDAEHVAERVDDRGRHESRAALGRLLVHRRAE